MNKVTGCIVVVIAVLLAGCNQPPEQTNVAPGPTEVAANQPVSGGEQTYVVTADDAGAFSGIAVKMYGDGKYWRLIAEADPGVDPRMLKPGDELFIPPLPAED